MNNWVFKFCYEVATINNGEFGVATVLKYFSTVNRAQLHTTCI